MVISEEISMYIYSMIDLRATVAFSGFLGLIQGAGYHYKALDDTGLSSL